MGDLSQLATFSHLLGMALALGAASVKLALVVKACLDPAFLPTFLAVRKPVTRFIILGLILATLSGGFWLAEGYPWSPLLIAKVVFVGLLWLVGPVIDNLVEPRLEKAAPVSAQSTPDFVSAQRTHLVFEVGATTLMYAAFVAGSAL